MFTKSLPFLPCQSVYRGGLVLQLYPYDWDIGKIVMPTDWECRPISHPVDFVIPLLNTKPWELGQVMVTTQVSSCCILTITFGSQQKDLTAARQLYSA